MSGTQSKYWDGKFICPNQKSNLMKVFFWRWKLIFTNTRKVLAGKDNLCDTLNKNKQRGLPSKLLWEAKTTSRGFWHQEHGAIHGGWYCCRMKRSCPSSWIPTSCSSSTAKAGGLEVCVLLIVFSRPFGISWLNILFSLYVFTLKVSIHYQKPNPKDLNKTRLTYNCAHLRTTNETLTIEYFIIILENFWGESFLGENLFWVKIFWVKTFFGENFWGETFFE